MKKYLLIFLYFGFLNLSSDFLAQCGNLNPNLGNDTLLCQGQSILLNPGTFSSYRWDNNSISPTRSVNQSGTYWVKVGNLDTTSNLITNGDFESGATGFLTGYNLATGSTGSYGMLSSEGYYAVVSSPNLAHTNFLNCEDHSVDPANQMMVVNGAATPTNVWCQTVNVVPNEDYFFGAWVSSALSDVNVAQLQFSINGSTLGAIFSPSSNGCEWDQFYEIWNSGINTSAQICVLNQNTVVSGNDFMIDDIQFATICYDYDSIQVNMVPKPVITVGPNDTICAGELSSISVNSPSDPLIYTWNPGAIQANELNVSPTTSMFYSVTGVDTNGCVSNLVSRLVHVSPSPSVTIVPLEDSVCLGEEVFLTANSPNANVSYLWSVDNQSAVSIVDIPTQSTIYAVTATNSIGCSTTDSVAIEVIQPLSLTISGNLTVCQGESTTLSVVSNYPNVNFVWENGSLGQSCALNPISNDFVTVTGSYLNCPSESDSVFVTVNPFPSFVVPNDLSICKGESSLVHVVSTPTNAEVTWLQNPILVQPSLNVVGLSDGYVSLFVTVNGCSSPIDSFFVDVLETCDITIPNVFTPNDDGSNDVFQLISMDGISFLKCEILDRWGNTIRTFDSSNFFWDGTNRSGDDVMEGVYFYTLSATTVSGESIERHGFITLER